MVKTINQKTPARVFFVVIKNHRLEIEEEEPPKNAVLDCYCHNELCRAMDKKKAEYVRIYFFQSWFKQYFEVFPSLLKKYGDIKNESARS